MAHGAKTGPRLPKGSVAILPGAKAVNTSGFTAAEVARAYGHDEIAAELAGRR
jgi:hypothetical protein